jgi:hypothetical protein
MSKLVTSIALMMGLTIGLVGSAIAQSNTASPMPAQQQKSVLPTMVVHKSPSCGCCTAWIKHMEQAGFRVEVVNEEKLDPIKRALGVPERLGSCHSAKVDRYFIEGHVPAEDVKRLLAERPNALGLAVPRMPIGSPGMEQGNRREPYDVLLVYRSGKASVFAQHGK